MKNLARPLKTLVRPLTAAGLFTVLALSGCSAAGSASAQGGGSAPSSSAPGGSASASASPSQSSGPFGDFPTAAQACSTIREKATGASLLPMYAAQGKTAELEQFKADLASTAQRAPETIKADFTNLKETAIAGLSDQTVYSSGKFDRAMAPVNAWLSANCK